MTQTNEATKITGRAAFSRKACNLQDLREEAWASEKEKYIIEERVEISESEYNDFKNDLLSNRLFIHDHIEQMYQDRDNIRHCILISTKGRKSGILVEAEGYDYARYAALYKG